LPGDAPGVRCAMARRWQSLLALTSSNGLGPQCGDVAHAAAVHGPQRDLDRGSEPYTVLTVSATFIVAVCPATELISLAGMRLR
jgi:hypothetical protein